MYKQIHVWKQMKPLIVAFLASLFDLRNVTNHFSIGASFSCVCPIIDLEFHHNIAHCLVDSQQLLNNVVTTFLVDNRADALEN